MKTWLPDSPWPIHESEVLFDTVLLARQNGGVIPSGRELALAIQRSERQARRHLSLFRGWDVFKNQADITILGDLVRDGEQAACILAAHELAQKAERGRVSVAKLIATLRFTYPLQAWQDKELRCLIVNCVELGYLVFARTELGILTCAEKVRVQYHYLQLMARYGQIRRA